MKTLKLPGGYVDEKGIVHREVELSPLTGKEEELVAQNHRQESASLVTMVLSRCLRRLGSIAPVPGDVTGRLPKEDRQFLLLKLREITFGDMVQATVTCPGHDCGNKVDINFSTTDITDQEQVDKEPQIELELEANCPECGREFTIPFDIPNFFFRELRTTIDLLYREVHFLAYHYHWSEQEILEMSREKRHKYIEILLEEIEKMTDERILPPVGFRYGNVNYPFMLDSQTHEPLTRRLYPLEEDNEMEVNGAQDPIDDDDGHEMNYHREKTQQKEPIKNETPQDSEVQDTGIEENHAEETRKRENIEIPGFSEKSIAFPSLDRENQQSQKPETVKDKVVETQLPGRKEISTEQAPIHITNSKSQITKGVAPPAQKEFQIPNSKSRISNPELQTNSNPQMLKKSQTLDRENRQSQKPESGDVPSSVGVNLVFTQYKDKIEFTDSLPVKDNVTEIETQLPENIGEIEDNNTVELEKFESPRQEHQPGRAGTKKAILATENTEAGMLHAPHSPKGHKNSLCDIGITSWNKNKKLKESSTENTELKKSLLSVNSVPSVAKNILPENGKISAIGNQIPNSELQRGWHPQPKKNSKSQMLNKSQTSDRENQQSQKPEPAKENVVETQLSGRREKSGDYEIRTGESTVKVIPGEKMVSRSNPEAVLRIEQLREQVRRLNQSKTLNPEISSSSPSRIEIKREIEKEEQVQTPSPPVQPVTMVKRLPTRTKTHQAECAFWERSYLGRFHLRTLR